MSGRVQPSCSPKCTPPRKVIIQTRGVRVPVTLAVASEARVTTEDKEITHKYSENFFLQLLSIH